MAKLILGNSLRERADHSPRLRRFIWACEAALVWLLLFLSGLLSPDRASAAGARLMRWLGPRLHKTGYLARNVEIAFPEKSPEEAEALIQDMWGNIGSIIAEYAHLQTICGHEAKERLEIVTRAEFEVFQKNGKPAIFVSAHQSNWEVGPQCSSILGAPVRVVYSPMQNPWIDRMLRRKRETLDWEVVSLKDGIRELVRNLQKGKPIGMLVDQRSDYGEPVPFFGSDMLTTLIPARLALRFGCELIPARVERLEGARFRVTFYEPIRPNDDTRPVSDQVLDMTAQINALFESWARDRPHEWFCSKRKWPKKTWAGIHHPRTQKSPLPGDSPAGQTLSANKRSSQSVTVRSS